MIVVLTRNSVKTVTPFFFFFFLSRKIVSKVHVTCHNHGHTSLSSARTFVEQNWPWTTQSGAQEYRNQFLHLHVIGARGTSSRTWSWHEFSLAELTEWVKSTPTVFKGAWLIRLPQSRLDCRIPLWWVCRNFEKKEGIWGTEWAHRWNIENVTKRT